MVLAKVRVTSPPLPKLRLVDQQPNQEPDQLSNDYLYHGAPPFEQEVGSAD